MSRQRRDSVAVTPESTDSAQPPVQVGGHLLVQFLPRSRPRPASRQTRGFHRTKGRTPERSRGEERRGSRSLCVATTDSSRGIETPPALRAGKADQQGASTRLRRRGGGASRNRGWQTSARGLVASHAPEQPESSTRLGMSRLHAATSSVPGVPGPKISLAPLRPGSSMVPPLMAGVILVLALTGCGGVRSHTTVATPGAAGGDYVFPQIRARTDRPGGRHGPGAEGPGERGPGGAHRTERRLGCRSTPREAPEGGRPLGRARGPYAVRAGSTPPPPNARHLVGHAGPADSIR